MTGSSITVERVDEDELGYVERILERASPPTEDLCAATGRFYVARDGADRIGTGCLEIYETVGLLRSVAVEKTARGKANGTEIVDALEAEAREAGVQRLYLLTTTVSGFFARRGYEEIDHTDAPEPVRNTTQFAELCPSAATAMGKPL